MDRSLLLFMDRDLLLEAAMPPRLRSTADTRTLSPPLFISAWVRWSVTPCWPTAPPTCCMTGCTPAPTTRSWTCARSAARCWRPSTCLTRQLVQHRCVRLCRGVECGGAGGLRACALSADPLNMPHAAAGATQVRQWKGWKGVGKRKGGGMRIRCCVLPRPHSTIACPADPSACPLPLFPLPTHPCLPQGMMMAGDGCSNTTPVPSAPIPTPHALRPIAALTSRPPLPPPSCAS